MKMFVRHKKAHGPLASLGLGLGVCICLYLLFSLIGAAVLGGIDNPLGGMGIASMLSFFPPAFFSGILISKFKGDGGVITAAVSALVFVLVLFLCCVVVTHAKIPFSSLISYIAYVVLTVIGGLLGKSRAKRRFRA